MSEKILTQRDAFWNQVYSRALEDKDIVIVTADMGAPSLDQFRLNLPAQFVNVGIAEQNAITIASGLAMCGKHPFVYAIAPFITLRCLEQIRVENAIMKLPITVVGVGAGFGYEDSGPTHHLIEDIAVMRSLPNITIHSISDNLMAEYIADLSCGLKETNYVRLDRKPQKQIYAEKTDFSKGINMVSSGADACIIATGCMVQTAIEAVNLLHASKGITIKVLDISRIPINIPELLKELVECKRIITLEEHFLQGGLGSAVLEILSDGRLLKKYEIIRIGLEHGKGYSYTYGGREKIHEFYGVDVDSVTKKICDFISCEH